ncbi:MAG: hypothetical protein QG657_2490, partial [Acidobacteriota bacterium]|nr:hypothetical protein [Acidobacteriota bacterium]
PGEDVGRAGELSGLDIDAAGGVFCAWNNHETIVFEFSHEGGLANVTAANEEEFAF